MRVWKIVAPSIEAWMVYVGDADAVEAERVRQARKYQRVTRVEEIFPSAEEWREAARRAGLPVGSMRERNPDSDASAEAEYLRRSGEEQRDDMLARADTAGVRARVEKKICEVMGAHRVVHPHRRINRYVRDPETLMTCDLGDDPGPYVWPTWAAAAVWVEAQNREAAQREETPVSREPEPVYSREPEPV